MNVDELKRFRSHDTKLRGKTKAALDVHSQEVGANELGTAVYAGLPLRKTTSNRGYWPWSCVGAGEVADDFEIPQEEPNARPHME